MCHMTPPDSHYIGTRPPPPRFTVSPSTSNPGHGAGPSACQAGFLPLSHGYSAGPQFKALLALYGVRPLLLPQVNLPHRGFIRIKWRRGETY